MNIKSMIGIVSRLTMVTMVIAVAGCQSGLKHPDFLRRREAIHTIAVVTHVEFYHHGVGFKQTPLPEIERTLQAKLVTLVTSNLTRHGYNVIIPELELLPATNKNDLALEAALIRLGSLTDSYDMTEYGTLKHQSNSLDRNNVQFISRESKTDAVLLVKVSGFQNSGGTMVMAASFNTLLFLAEAAAQRTTLVGEMPVRGITSVETVLIEGSTGDVLWTNHAQKSGNIPKLELIVRDVFKQFEKSAKKNK